MLNLNLWSLRFNKGAQSFVSVSDIAVYTQHQKGGMADGGEDQIQALRIYFPLHHVLNMEPPLITLQSP